jgi:hypothetical protein
VQTAKGIIISVGADCRCPTVLDQIHLQLARGIKHIRILPGPPSEHVREYLCKLLRNNPKLARGPEPQLRIGRCRPEDVGRVQVCANEHRAIFVFDLGLLFNGDSLCLEFSSSYLCRHVLKYVAQFYERHCEKIRACNQLNTTPRPRNAA